MRIVSAITAQRLDVVLMDAEARDAFAAQGYLADLSSLIPGPACQWLDVSQTPLIRQAGFPEAVYLGCWPTHPTPSAPPLISTICSHKKGRTVHGYLAIGEILIDLTQTGTGENGIPSLRPTPAAPPQIWRWQPPGWAHRPPLSAR